MGWSPIGEFLDNISVTRLGAPTVTSEQPSDYPLISAIYYSELLSEPISLAVAL
jgi:hypothetical protein